MRRKLTKPQQQMLDFLATNPSYYTQQELAKGAGFDHHQKATAAIMGLFMKGYIVLAVDPPEDDVQ